MLQTVQKQFTYRQYILTDDIVQNTHTYTQYTQCTIRHTYSYQVMTWKNTKFTKIFFPGYQEEIYIYIYIHTHTHTHTHIYIYIYIYIHSLATLLGTPCLYRVGSSFALRTALILRGIDSTRCWKHSSEILVHIVMIASHSCCRFVGCTSMMWISRSTTSQRCSIRLRSGDCGGHLSKVNSLSCSRNQSEMIWSLWHGALSCWK